MWWLLLRFIGVRDIASLIVRLGMVVALFGTGIAALYALGFDPISIVWDWFVDLVGEAARDSIGL